MRTSNVGRPTSNIEANTRRPIVSLLRRSMSNTFNFERSTSKPGNSIIDRRGGRTVTRVPFPFWPPPSARTVMGLPASLSDGEDFRPEENTRVPAFQPPLARRDNGADRVSEIPMTKQLNPRTSEFRHFDARPANYAASRRNAITGCKISLSQRHADSRGTCSVREIVCTFHRCRG